MKKILSNDRVKPFLKWAGGKTQILPFLEPYLPKKFNQYIEPFLGGGALFFFLKSKISILSDSNEELINSYLVVKESPIELIKLLSSYKNDEKFYYELREQKISTLSKIERAARMVYLNKTCFNGLYRVNKKGEFNVPYGRMKNPNICDAEGILKASKALENSTIVFGDYQSVLKTYAKQGDFVYLDPPYHPLGGYSDFQRYTKEYFYESDHIDLRNEVNRLISIGCSVIENNANTEFIKELYKGYNVNILNTRRHISSKSSTRMGEDIIISSNKAISNKIKNELILNFPGTRYMGSKYRLLPFIWDILKGYKFDSVLDAFSGSACTSYMFKTKGLQVFSNDYLHFAYVLAHSLIENQDIRLDKGDIKVLLKENKKRKNFVSSTFKDLYFIEAENEFLDNLVANIPLLKNEFKEKLAMSSIIRACLKKRPRGLFTFTGLNRYDDGRKDLKVQLSDHFIDNILAFNNAIFNNNKKNKSFNNNIFDLDLTADLIYLDPPYLTPHSDNDYTRRYHFVEGLSKNWENLEIQAHTKTKKFKSYNSEFSSKFTINNAFEKLFEKYKNSIIVLSYSSNSIPEKKEIERMLKEYKKNVQIFEENLTYSFGNQGNKIGNETNRVKEYLFIGV